MERAKFIGLMIFMMLLIGFAGAELGITQTPVEDIIITKPESSGGFLGTLNNIVAPFIIIWDLLGSFFQIVAFQAQGIPPTINTIIFVPVAGIMGWLIVKVIRG